TDRRSDERGDRRGTGLGMTICKRLLDEVGGWMWVSSAAGRGTEVGVVVGG
ncbi:MAG: ATP-binding protein, partial [Phycisphaerales bacterium]